MKKVLLATLALTSLVQSCAPKKADVGSGAYKDKIVLGNFYDVTSASTLNEAALKDLPRKINLNDQTTAVKNQSDRGTCTFFATAALLESAIKIDRNEDVNLSEEFMNLVTKYSGDFSTEEGSTVSSNLSATKSYGLMLERDWGYQPSWFQAGLPCAKYQSSDSSAPKECFMHNVPSEESQKSIIAIEGMNFGSIQKNTNEIIRFLAQYQRPLTVDVSVNFNGWPQSGDVFYNAELRKECLKSPDKCGGHSVLLTGYDLDKKVFFFKNSWGKEWGQNGYGTMTFEMVDRYVNSSLYWAQATEKLAIPEDHAESNLELVTFDAKSALEEGTLTTAVTADVRNINGQLIYISSFLAKKSKLIPDLPGDTNTSIVTTTDGNSVKAMEYIIPEGKYDLLKSEEAPLMLSFSQAHMNSSSVKSLLASETDEAVLRTTIYVHTDDQTYKVIKRIYKPINE